MRQSVHIMLWNEVYVFQSLPQVGANLAFMDIATNNVTVSVMHHTLVLPETPICVVH